MKHLLKDKTAPIGVDYAIVSYDSVNDKVIVKGGSEPTPPQPTYEYVDLGLPSGTKWATCNVGATKPEEYGLYFQWGDIEGRTADEIADKPCTWATAPFGNGSSDFDEEYFYEHRLEWLDGDVLKPEYDAAYVATGGAMRMPTQAEFDELLSGTTNEWTTENGVYGGRFTSKTDSSKYIFIPASGFIFYSSMEGEGSCVQVWSSTFENFGHGDALSLYFDRFRQMLDMGSLELGLSVRGVRN